MWSVKEVLTVEGYQTPQKVVSSSYLDLKHFSSSFSLIPHRSTTLIETQRETDRLKCSVYALKRIVILIQCWMLVLYSYFCKWNIFCYTCMTQHNVMTVFTVCATWCNIYAVSVLLQPSNFLLQFTLYGIKQQQLLTLHTNIQKQRHIRKTNQIQHTSEINTKIYTNHSYIDQMAIIYI